MIKKAVVLKHKGKPIEVLEVVELNDIKLKDFLSACQKNLIEEEIKEAQLLELKLKEEKALLDRVRVLEEQNLLLKKAVCVLGGLEIDESKLDENIKQLIKGE